LRLSEQTNRLTSAFIWLFNVRTWLGGDPDNAVARATGSRAGAGACALRRTAVPRC